MAAWQQSVEERLRALETAPQAAHTSIVDDEGNVVVALSGDGLEFYDVDGNRISHFGPKFAAFYAPTGETIVLIGEITWLDLDQNREEPGMLVQRTDGKDMFAVGASNRGILSPRLPYQPRRLNQFESTTSGSFTSLWQFIVPGIPSNSVRVIIDTSVSTAGTTGQVRLTIPGVASTDPISFSDTSPNARYFQWDLEAAGLDIASYFFLNVEARRTAGTGDIIVFEPHPATTWDDLNHGADVDGIY
jgi:hypothetical protein